MTRRSNSHNMPVIVGAGAVAEDSETYYRRRWSEEMSAAERATDPIAAGIHRSLAARYLALIEGPLRLVE